MKKKTGYLGKKVVALTIVLAMVFQFCVFPGGFVWAAETFADEAVVAAEQQEPEGTDAGEAPDTDAGDDAVSQDDAAGVDSAEPGNGDGSSAPDAAEEYPAQILKVRLGDTIVTLDAPVGALPTGATMSAAKVDTAAVADAVEAAADEAGKTVADMVAIDVTLFDKDGNEIQPKVPVQVRFANAGLQAGEVSVYHIDEQTGVAQPVQALQATTSVQQFKADSFSVYVVVDSGENARALVRFMDANGTELASMYVKQADVQDGAVNDAILYDPGVGTVPEGASFKGWTTDPDYTDSSTAKTIAEVRTEVGGIDWSSVIDADAEDGTVITYYPVLLKSYTITYLGDANASLGQTVVEFRADTSGEELAKPYTVNMAYTPVDDEHSFEGWLVRDGKNNIEGYTEGDMYANGTEITITGNVTFAVHSPSGFWLVFDENGKGATYNAPQFVTADEVTKAPSTTMVRNGYTFGGWYDTKEHADAHAEDPSVTEGEFTFGNALTAKTTIYASWIPNKTAGYTVIIWRQNVSGEGYDFEEAISLTGNVGSLVDTVREAGTGDNRIAYINDNPYSFTGFHLDRFDTAVEIKTEGSSVVNVYYNRNQVTLNFNVYDYTYTVSTGDNDNNPPKYGDVNGQKARVYWNNGAFRTSNSRWGTVYNGTVYTRSNNQSWHVPYTMTGLYGSTLESNDYSWPTDYDWYDGTGQGRKRITFLDAFLPASGASTVEFYGETPATGRRTVTFYKQNANQSGYTEANQVGVSSSTAYSTFYISDKYNGFYAAQYRVNGGTWQNVGAKDPATGYYGDPIDFTQSLEIRFNRVSCTLAYMDGSYYDGNDNWLSSGTVELGAHEGIYYGADMSSYNGGPNYDGDDGDNYFVPEPVSGNEDYTFAGWYLDSACTQPCTFSTMPEGGLTVYAKWIKTQYRVFLHPNAGTDSTLDWGSDDQAMSFRVSSGDTIDAPEGLRDGYVFVGWYTDESCSAGSVFNESVVLNDSTVSTEYDKTTHMTDTMDKWGNVNEPKFNSDATGYYGKDRFWISREFNLYGKWRKTLDGADGIGVLYDLNGGPGTAPTDTNLYVDNATASAAAAASAPTGQRFDHWVMQTWSETDGKYIDVDSSDPDYVVYPGGDYTVLADNAHKVPTGEFKKDADGNYLDINGQITTDPDKYVPLYTYTVQLRAEYVDIEEATPTFIPWFMNDGTEAYHIDTGTDPISSTLGINEGVPIQAPPTRTGYSFLGWAKVDMSSSDDPATAAEEAATFMETSSNYTQPDLTTFLYYNSDDQKFYTDADFTDEAEQVAADEFTPYQAMFAMWCQSIDVKVVGSSTTKEYNGNTQSNTDYTVEYWLGDQQIDSLPSGITCTVTATQGGQTVDPIAASGKDVGTYTATVTATLSGSAEGYTIGTGTDSDDVILIIDPAEVTLTGASDSKVYNGDEQELSGYTCSVDGLTFEDVTATGSGTDVDEYDVSFDGVTVGETTDTTGNYVVAEVVPGTLTIMPREIAVSVEDATTTYNGSTQYGSDELSWDNLVTGHTATVTYTPSSGKDASTTPYDNGSFGNDFAVEDADGVDVTGNYTLVEKTAGKLTINPATGVLTVEPVNYNETYDGETHNGGASASVTEGTTITYSTDGGQTWTNTAPSIKNVGTVDYKVKASNPNYGEATADGTLIVTPKAVTVSVLDKTTDYNGQTQYGNTEPNWDGLVSGHTATVTYTPSSGKDASTTPYDNGSFGNDFAVEDADGVDVTSNYTLGTQTPGKLTINAPKTHTVTVNYIYTDGSQAAEPNVITGVAEGEHWGPVNSPTISGYTPDRPVVQGDMEDEDIVVTVTYTANAPTPPAGGDPTPGGPTPPTPTPNPTTTNPTTGPTTGATASTPAAPATSSIDENATPLADAAGAESAWALLNLILAILTALLTVILLIGYFIGKRDDDEDEENRDEDEESKINRKGVPRVLSIIPAVAGIVLFLLTEDMSLPQWVWVDGWTIFMAVIFVVQLVLTGFSKKTNKDEEGDDNDQTQAGAYA